MTLTLKAAKHRAASRRGMALTLAQREARNAVIDRLRDDEGETYERIGKLLGISRERVRQLRVARGKRTTRTRS